MRILQQCPLSAFLAAGVGCSDSGHKPLPRISVEVAQDLPPSLSNAVLHLVIVEPSDASPTNNYASKMTGNRSLKSPVGSSSVSDGHYQEERLVAISADGFVMRFTKDDGQGVRTNVVLFRYGETTETNALGCKIVGRFK